MSSWSISTLKRIIPVFCMILIAVTAADMLRAQDSCRCMPVFASGGGSNPDSALVDTCGVGLDSVSCDDLFGWRSYSTYAKRGWRMRFHVGALDLPAAHPDSTVEAEWEDIDSAYSTLRDRFEDLELQFGQFYFRKVYPGDTDEIRGREFSIYFTDYVNADSVMQFLDATDSIVSTFMGIIRTLGVPNDPGMKPDRDLLSIRTMPDGPHNVWGDFTHRTGWQWQMYKQKLPMAWEITKGKQSVILCDHDLWIGQVTHPDFITDVSGPNASNRNFTHVTETSKGDGAYATLPLMGDHGLSVTSEMVAKGDNDTGMVGACPNCNAVGVYWGEQPLFNLRHIDADLTLNSARHRVVVVNFSHYNDPGYEALDDAMNAGIICVAAAGNRESNPPDVPNAIRPAASTFVPDPLNPANDYKVIAVGATRDGTIHRGSDCAVHDILPPTLLPSEPTSRGAETFMWNFNYSPNVSKFDMSTDANARRAAKQEAFMDLCAGTGFTLDAREEGNGLYGMATGTSQAAPQVAGTCGLMVTISPYLGVTLGGNGLPVNGIDVQRKAYNILTFTADKVIDEGSIYTVWGNIDIPAPSQPEYVKQENDVLKRSWAQRMGFGRLNAYRAVAHAIPSKGNYSYTASATIDGTVATTLNEGSENLIHFGHYLSSGVSVYTGGGKAMPGGDPTHLNQGETLLDGSGITLSVASNVVAAFDGITTTGNATGGNKIVAQSGGKILMTGYLRDIEVKGRSRIADLTINGSTESAVARVSLGSAVTSEMYETIRLIGSGEVRVDVGTLTLKPGCTVEMTGTRDLRITGGGVLEMESATTIDGAARTIYVGSGSKLVVKEKARVSLLTRVVVEDGGEVIFEPYSQVKLNRFWVATGGTFTIQKGCRVELNTPVTNECYGKLYVEGDNSDLPKSRVTIIGVLDDCCLRVCTTVVAAAKILAMGSSSFPELIPESHLRLRYADVSNVPIQAVDITRDRIEYCNFSASRDLLEKGDHLLAIEYTGMPNWDFTQQPLMTAEVFSCTFADEEPEITNVARRLATYQINGLKLYNMFNSAVVENCDFDRQSYAISTLFCNNVLVENNRVRTSNIGLADAGSGLRICNNGTENTDYPVSFHQMKSAQLFSNVFITMRWGVSSRSSGLGDYRANIFSNYKLGLFAMGSSLNLTGRLIPDSDPPMELVYGRNNFGVEPNWIGFGTGPNDDIMLRDGSRLSIECGKNRMGLNSRLHLNNQTGESIGVGTNQWRDPNVPAGFVRTNGSFAGTPLDVGASSSAICDEIEDEASCIIETDPIPCGDHPFRNDGVWWARASSSVYIDSAYITARDMMYDTTLPVPCRKVKSRDALYASVLSDSVVGKVTTLISDYGILVADPSTPTDLKPTLLMLQGEARERIGQYALADTSYRHVVEDYPASADSVPAAWRRLYLDARISDTTRGMEYDSAMSVYNARVLADLRRMSGDVEVSMKQVREESDGNYLPGASAMLGQNQPNPFGAGTRIPYTLHQPGHVRMELVDIHGNVVRMLVDREEGRGGHEVMFDSEGLPAGTYIYRLHVNGEVHSRSMIISR